MPDSTPRHGFDTNYEDGEAWDYNPEFNLLDELINERGSRSDRPAVGDYDGEMYEAIDERIIYRWDGSNSEWTEFAGLGTEGSPITSTVYRETMALGSDALMVTPETHDFDDIVAELNEGTHVIATPGDYAATTDLPDVTDGSLKFMEGARVDVPDNPSAGWLNIQGSAHTASTVITENVSAGDVEIVVDDASAFESGVPALLNDDGGYETMNGRGEIVYVSDIDTASDSATDTITVRDKVALSHDTSDAIDLEAMDPLTDEHSWEGVTFDCRGTQQTSWPLVTRHHVDGHEFRNITFINGEGSSMHQYMEDRESYAPKVIDSRNGRVTDLRLDNDEDTPDANNLGLFWSSERQTRYAELRDCTVYWGNVAEFGNNGTGPSVNPRFINVTVNGGAFSSNPTVIRPYYKNCYVSDNNDPVDGRDAAFLSDGVDARFEDCTVEGSFTGFELRGYREQVIDCTVKECGTSAVRFGSDGGGHSDAQTGTKRIDGLNVIDSQSSTVASIGSPSRAKITNLYAENSGYVLSLAGGPDHVEVNGATIRGSEGIVTTGISRLTLRNMDVNNQGGSGDWYRETSGDVFDHLLIENCDFYGINSGSAVRVEGFRTVEMNNCRVPQGEAEVGHYLLREEGGNQSDSQVILRGNDARNTALNNGYELLSGGEISDGTNLTNQGGTI